MNNRLFMFNSFGVSKIHLFISIHVQSFQDCKMRFYLFRVPY
jgi:hypothetical protein